MDPGSLISLIGMTSIDEEVEAALRYFKIRRRPRIEVDEDDLDGPIVESRDWVINSRAGVEFGFEDEASFHGYDAIRYDPYSMLLTQIYFYGEHEGVDHYKGRLPFEIMMSDSRGIVREKMSAWEGTRRSYIRDVWELPECRLTVSYVQDGQRIGFILLGLRREAMPPLDVSIAMPDIQDIIESLGTDIQSPDFQNLFHQFPLSRYQEDWELYLKIDLRELYGFELRFQDDLGLSHVIFYREHEMGTRGWQGLLPCSLEFDDSPETILSKISQPPVVHSDELFIGNALWSFDSHSIRANYSTMKNFLLSLELLAPGALDAYSS